MLKFLAFLRILMMSWPEEESDVGDCGSAGTNGFAGAGAGVAGAGFGFGFGGGLGAAAGDCAKVVVETMETYSTRRSEKKIVCFIFLLVIENF